MVLILIVLHIYQTPSRPKGEQAEYNQISHSASIYKLRLVGDIWFPVVLNLFSSLGLKTNCVFTVREISLFNFDFS